MGGCASPTGYRNALYSQYGQTDFDRDWYECRRENSGAKGVRSASMSAGGSSIDHLLLAWT